MRVRTALTIALVGIVAALLSTGPSHARARVHLFLGQKFLDEDDWPGSDQHDEVGVLVTAGLRRWPVQVAIDLLVSAGDADAIPGLVVLDQYTIELDLGVRKTWERGHAMVFVGRDET